MIKLFYELILGVLWSISIMLHGNSDSCDDDDNDGGGVQNVSDGKDGDDMMIMPMTTMRMVVATMLAALMVSVIEATMTTTTMMTTTMTAATQQSNGARIGEGTTMATAMSTMFATTTVVVTKVAALTVKGSSIDSERRQR